MGNPVGFHYWWRWQVPLCALIISLPGIICAILIKKKLKTGDPLENCCLWIPCWKGLNPRWLLLYRALAFFSMAWLLYQMVASDGLFSFYFYTQWTFALVMLYFAVGTIISAQGCLSEAERLPLKDGEKDEFLNSDPEDTSSANTASFRPKEKALKILQKNKQAGFLGYFMHTIYQISAGAVVLTDIVFWCVLVPLLSGKEFEVTLLIGCIHSLNAVFLIIDSALNNLPFQMFGFAYFVIWSVVYIIFQWVLHACGFTWWPYPFLELATPWAPLWYFGLAVFHVPCYGLYLLLMKAKLSAFSRLFPQAFVRLS